MQDPRRNSVHGMAYKRVNGPKMNSNTKSDKGEREGQNHQYSKMFEIDSKP